MAKSREPVAEISAMKFEAAVAELERIVQLMEGSTLPLEDSIAAYQRGTELLRHCQQQLDSAEARLRVLDGDTLKPLNLETGSGT